MGVLYVNDTSTTEIYPYGHTLSLHDALPIYLGAVEPDAVGALLQMRQVDHEPGVDVEAEALAVAAHRRQVAHRTIGLPLALLGGHALGEAGQHRRARPQQIGKASGRERACQYV